MRFIKITVGISGRHIHLNEKDYNLLFKNQKYEIVKELNQPHQYATNLLVNIKTDYGVIKNVRFIGPFRELTQVEISKTDAIKLGITPPISNFVDPIKGALINIESPTSSIKRKCAIIATRHIHLTDEDIIKNNMDGLKTVSIKVLGEKGGILDNVYLRKSKEAYFELHLDTDDANSHLLKSNDFVEIIK